MHQLGKLCHQITDGTHFTPKYVDELEGQIKFISVKDVREFEISFDNVKYISEEEHLTLSKRCNPQPQDILLTKVGTIGLAAVIPNNAPTFDLFVSVCLIKPKKEVIDNHFLCAVLNSPIARLQFSRDLKGVGVPDLHLENIAETLIPLPPLDIQKLLVTEIEAARQSRKQKLAQADELLSSLDGYLLDQLGLNMPEKSDQKVFAVSRRTLCSAQRINVDYFHPERILAIREQENRNSVHSQSLTEFVDFVRETISGYDAESYIGMANIKKNTGELFESNDKEIEGKGFIFAKNDVLFARLRPYLNKVYRTERSGICSTEFHVIRIKEKFKNKIFPDYLATILRSSLILAQTKHMMTGNTHPRLANEDVINLIVPIPEIKLQEHLVVEIQNRRTEARRLRQEAETEWETAKTCFEQKLLGEA